MWAGRHRRWSNRIWDVKLGHAGRNMAEQSQRQERARMAEPGGIKGGADGSIGDGGIEGNGDGSIGDTV